MRAKQVLLKACGRLKVPHWEPNGPNYVTLSRMTLGAPSVFLAISFGNWEVGLGLFTWFVFSDFLDGQWARLMSQKSAWGAYCDPAADKLFCGPILIGGWVYFGLPLSYAFLIVVIASYDMLVMWARSIDLGMKTHLVAKTKQVTLFAGIGILIATEGGIIPKEYADSFHCSLTLWGLTPDGFEGITNTLLTFGDQGYCSPETWGKASLWFACFLTLISLGLYVQSAMRREKFVSRSSRLT